MKKIKFIDLFAGIGGMRIGFENACKYQSIGYECVFSSEIKDHALAVYKEYFGNHIIHGDIIEIETNEIPDFDFLLAGFPCQSFSSAGKRMGFLDTRGTLFFEIERILKAKRPYGFILENVEGLVNHDKVDKNKKIGRTLETILGVLNGMGYHVSYNVLNSKDFGVPQERKRVFIVGTLDDSIGLDGFLEKTCKLKEVIEDGKELMDTKLTRLLLSYYKPHELHGKSVKDKRGGRDNIHSWDIGIKGKVTDNQKELLGKILTERRKMHWAEKKGIKWMDGMPLTADEIRSFYNAEDLDGMLEDLVSKGYLRYEHPKELVTKDNGDGENVTVREHHKGKDMGYNIVAGKLSFEISKILDPDGVAPTLVATDMSRLAVVDGGGLRRITLNEGLKMFGFPDGFTLDVDENVGYDLLGNTVAVPVVEAVAKNVLGKVVTKETSHGQYELNNFL